MATEHVKNGLRYKEPRFDIINSEEPRFYKNVYKVQTSTAWELMMSILSFLHMYLIVFENTGTEGLYRIGSPFIYFCFILDFVMQTYH